MVFNNLCTIKACVEPKINGEKKERKVAFIESLKNGKQEGINVAAMVITDDK